MGLPCNLGNILPILGLAAPGLSFRTEYVSCGSVKVVMRKLTFILTVLDRPSTGQRKPGYIPSITSQLVLPDLSTRILEQQSMNREYERQEVSAISFVWVYGTYEEV
jgi:hypothetical protein